MTRKLPTKKRIADAWRDAYGYDTPWGQVVDWGEPQCWACCYYADSWPDNWDEAKGLERCHIVPRAKGGLDEPLNLVLLCQRCHEESPDHEDSRYMFMWIRRRPKRVLGTWLASQLDEMTRLTSLAMAKNWSEESLNTIVQDFLAKSGTHLTCTSDGTRQALLWKLAEEIEGAQ